MLVTSVTLMQLLGSAVAAGGYYRQPNKFDVADGASRPTASSSYVGAEHNAHAQSCSTGACGSNNTDYHVRKRMNELQALIIFND
jgi:hypothetical protein